MKLFIENDIELQKVKENGFKVFFLNDKTYINLNSIQEVEDNKFLLDFKNYTSSKNLQLFQETLNLNP